MNVNIKPSFNGARWDVGIRWLNTMDWLLLMGFGQQLYNFTPWIDGKQWYLGSTSLNHQSMIFGGYITLHVPSDILIKTHIDL